VQYEGSEAELRALVRACPTAMVVVSEAGTILLTNPAAHFLLGYSSSERFTGRALIELMAPEDVDSRPLDAGRLVGGRPVENERALLRADGSRVWVKSTTQRLPDGRILLWLRDLTEQHLLETQLRESQKLETSGLLAAGLAHDLNNLLTVITGHAELLCLPSRDEATQRSASCIATAAERAAELTRKLLAFGRKQVLHPRPIQLNELVQKNLELIRSMAGERIEVYIDSAPELDLVEVDPTQMEQALWNLVSNACQAMEGGGRLTVRTANVELDAHARDSLARPRPDPRFVALSIEDTGAGMREETVRRVFDPFFTTKQSGSGLGLSVVHGVVGQSGGLVRVRSKLGHGSCFELCLPRCEPRHVSVPAASRLPSVQLNSGTLLLVEDQSPLRGWLSQALQRRGFSVHALGDPEEALAYVERASEPPLAIISDVNMPRMTGPELITRLRKHWPVVPVVFITGYAEEDVFRSLPAGCELLMKPFTAAALVERLTALCGS
jgi:two-component system cell cycle sensor histidine kinase/response regulator CckA